MKIIDILKDSDIRVGIVMGVMIIALLVQYNANNEYQSKVKTLMSDNFTLRMNIQHRDMLISDLRKMQSSPEKSEESCNQSLPKRFTPIQVRTLQRAFEIGKNHDLSYTMMGIVLQETLAGEFKRVGHMSAPFGKRSYGIAQVKLTAARDVLKAFPHLKSFDTDEELISHLIMDDSYNIRIALHYFKLLKDRGFTWREAITAYNLGPTGMKRVDNPHEYKYVRRVVNHINLVKQEFSSN